MICPGRASVSWPFSSSTVPLTITWSMPTASRRTWIPPPGSVASGDKAAVVHVVHQRRLAGQPVDRLFERHRLLLAHPVAEQLRAGLVTVGGVRTAAAVAGADDRVLRAEDVLLRLRIVVAVDRDKAGLQILVERQVEEGVHDAFVLFLGDLLDALAFEMPVL